MFMVGLHSKFHLPRCSGPLVIAIKSEAKHRLHAAAMLLFKVIKIP
jgi:hypothetical protein